MIEKILKEINRLKKELDGYSALEALDYIESYINTLPEEHNEDLEEEIQRAYYDKSLYDADNLDRQDFNNIACHFAEWKRKKDLQDFLGKTEEFLYLQLNNGSIECGNIEKLIEQFKNYMQNEM